MIVTEKYAIGHIPKTGGDAAKAYFNAGGIEFDRQLGSTGCRRKHWSFDELGIVRTVHALTIRRLPHRELSNNHHRKPPPMDRFFTPDELIDMRLGERSLARRIDNCNPVSEWIRCENLLEDIVEFIKRHHGFIPDIAGTKTKGRQGYDHDIWKFWSKEQVVRLYKASPTWAAVEEEVYGGLVI